MAVSTRKDERADLRKIAHIETMTPCVVADISKSGARLIVDEAAQLPDKFVIVLRNDLRRWCQVKWRKADRVGVQFIADARA